MQRTVNAFEDNEQEGLRLALLGVPVEQGAGQLGAVMGPASLRTAGLRESLEELGHTVADHGDIDARSLALPSDVSATENARYFPKIAAWSRRLSSEAYDLMQQDFLPIFIGGDHSLSMGSVNGVARYWQEKEQELFVLWLDAHADFNTPLTSPSGNMHGMPAAALCGEPGLEGVFGPEPRAQIDPHNLHLFGIRSIDRGERALLRARGVDVVDMRHIDEFGVAVPMRRFLDKVAAREGVLHVSFDIDFLDPTLAPGVGTTVPGGATYREAHLIMEMLHDSGLVRSVDVVELNPFMDDRGKSAKLLVELLTSLFGRQIIDRPAPGRA